MRRRPLSPWLAWARRRFPLLDQRGDTLVEVLIALVILGLATAALIGGLVTSITSSSEHRSLTNVDTVLKNFVEAAKSAIQGGPSSTAAFSPCASNYEVAGAPNPSSGASGLTSFPVTVFASGFDPGTGVTVNFPTAANTSAATIVSGGTVLTTPVKGAVAVTFDVPAEPSGSYPIQIAGTGASGSPTTVMSDSDYTVTPWAGDLSSSGTNTYVVNATGFDAYSDLNVSIGGQDNASNLTNIVASAYGSDPDFTFTVPATDSGDVLVTEGTHSAVAGAIKAATPSSVVSQSNTSLEGYSVGIGSVPSAGIASGVEVWNSSSNGWVAAAGSCASGENSNFELITVVASSPNGVSDYLSFVVSQEAYDSGAPVGTTPATGMTLSPASISQPTSSTQSVPETLTAASGDTFTSTFTLSLNDPGDSNVSISGTPTLNGAQNQISFTLSVAVGATVNTNYSFIVTEGANSYGCWNCLAITAPTILVITQQPLGSTAGSAIGSPSTFPAVEAESNGSPVGGVTITATVASGPGGFASSSTTSAVTNASTGIATFSNLVLDTAGNYTLTFTASGYTSVTSSSFTVSPAACYKFAFPAPSTATAGASFSVSLTCLDQYGNTATSFTGAQCITFSGPGNSPSPSNQAPTYPAHGSCATVQSSLTFASGVDSSISVTLYDAQSTMITATQGAIMGTTSSITVSSGAPHAVTITQQPTNVVHNVAITPAPAVTVTDLYSNDVANVTVTVTKASGSGSGSLSGTTSTTNASGLATFAGLKVSAAGTYTLTFTAGTGGPSVNSKSFTVS